MHSMTANLSQLSDAALLAAVSNNVQDNRAALVLLLRYLGEVDARKLYARQGYASLFAFCQSLRFSESEAYKRCLVGRLGRRFPKLLEAIGTGELHLTGAAMIAAKMDWLSACVRGYVELSRGWALGQVLFVPIRCAAWTLAFQLTLRCHFGSASI